MRTPRGHRRGRRLEQQTAWPWCECGASRVNPDGSVARACPRCTVLDGAELSPAARALISELRQLGRATWAAIEMELPEYDRRSLYRALRELDRIGRVRRLVIDNANEEHGMALSRTAGRMRGFHLVGSETNQKAGWVVPVAAFELVEPKS